MFPWLVKCHVCTTDESFSSSKQNIENSATVVLWKMGIIAEKWDQGKVNPFNTLAGTSLGESCIVANIWDATSV